jgi:hypothetical protein
METASFEASAREYQDLHIIQVHKGYSDGRPHCTIRIRVLFKLPVDPSADSSWRRDQML